MYITYGPVLNYFWMSLSTGFVLALFYDLIKVTRRLFDLGDIAVNAGDIVFLLVSAATLLMLAYKENNGRFRMYSIISATCAFGIYRLTVKSRLCDILEKLCLKVASLGARIFGFILLPFKFIISKSVIPLFKKIRRAFCGLVDIPHKFMIKRRH